MNDRTRSWLAALSAFVLLDASLTFENIWPTPAVRWAGGLSIELAVCTLAFVAVAAWRGEVSKAATRWIAALWIVLVLGRYVAVTAPALYGRDINLYWDLRFIPDVAAMIVRVAPAWSIVLAAAAVLLAIVLLYALLRWAFDRIAASAADTSGRRWLAVASALMIALFVVERRGVALPAFLMSPPPVLQTYLHQLELVLEARSGSTSLPPSPDIASSFANVGRADVFLVFVESYGAVSYAPELGERLAAGRRQLDADIHDTRRDVLSAWIESPTFGGSSWLAHLSLLSGVDVHDPDTNALLMTQRRDTMVRAFSRHGFRTIALMPGLRQRWPEGSFYGFDEIYGADQLAYTGPEFGWFALPDQYSLARFDALEAERSAVPRLVFFPTISTHFPFSPTPPYQPNWARMLSPRPYDGPDIVRAYARQPDWVDFRPGYVDALIYDFSVLGGYLRQHPDRDLVMILIGDHQPPAAVSGEGATWNVPVHVIAHPGPLLDALADGGFRRGLTPQGAALGRMHALLPLLLDAFGSDGQ